MFYSSITIFCWALITGRLKVLETIYHVLSFFKLCNPVLMGRMDFLSRNMGTLSIIRTPKNKTTPVIWNNSILDRCEFLCCLIKKLDNFLMHCFLRCVLLCDISHGKKKIKRILWPLKFPFPTTPNERQRLFQNKETCYFCLFIVVQIIFYYLYL
jgi:hypothetical protein